MNFNTQYLNSIDSSIARDRAPYLVGSVVEARIYEVIKHANGSRVVYAIVDLDRELTSAIGMQVATIPLDSNSKIEVAIHPELAIDGLEQELLTNDVATRFRNCKDDGVVATVFSVPGRQMEAVLQSLGSVERVNQAWLCDPSKASVWASETLPGYEQEILGSLTEILSGLMDSDILVSARMLADFCSQISESMRGHEGLTLINAVNRALPHLRLPRDCLLETRVEVLTKNAATQFRRLHDQFQPHLYLISKKGDIRPRSEMIDKIQQLTDEGRLEADVIEPLKTLVEDRTLATGIWRDSQQTVANLSWPKVQAFFDVRSPKQKLSLGAETINFFEDSHPDKLTGDEVNLLERLKRETDELNPEFEEFFSTHRELLRGNARLHKKWERLIYDKAVEEEDDLLLGLLRLAERALSGVDDIANPVLIVFLRGAESLHFWTQQKNTDLCAYLRDRYRGLEKVLKGNVELRFGRCWNEDWERQRVQQKLQKNKRGASNAEFEFEAYVVPKEKLFSVEADENYLNRFNKAQMTWKPGHLTFATALSGDLKRVLQAGENEAFLLRTRVTPSRSTGSTRTQRATIYSVASITDSLGESTGGLANPDDYHPESETNRLDLIWEKNLKQSSNGILTDDERKDLCEAFRKFRKDYTQAIAAMVNEDGDGLSDSSLIDQAKSYGILLTKLRKIARTDSLVREIWEPLLMLGTATVRGGSSAIIVTPWHPLRLLELSVKASQIAKIMSRIITSSSSATDIKEYVNDRLRVMRKSYYANIGLFRTNEGASILAETEFHAGYSLLELLPTQTEVVKSEGTEKDSVQRFEEITNHYLAKYPHERANFSTVLLDMNSEELPVMMANYLANQIEGDADLRCDLTIAHENVGILRQIYEQQNRRIGYEIESSLASEAARNFLSRLRVRIVDSQSLSRGNGTKLQDVLLLHDVIARHAELTWHEVSSSCKGNEILEHVPNDVSFRKSQSRGQLSTSVYLTSPSQIKPSQAYLDAVHDAIEGSPSDASIHFIPAQVVSLASPKVGNKLEFAHDIANWVITYDRIADRRVIEQSDDRLRILRYFSTPRSLHNVIVSTEYTRDEMRDRLHEDLEKILPGHDDAILKNLIEAVYKSSAKLSGGIVMRGAQWDNYARELIGIIVAQREINLLLSKEGENRTAMFFLDEFKEWLELTGEIADILAVDLCVSSSIGPKIRLVVSEAKCIKSTDLSKNRGKSWSQLENTYSAIVNRFIDGEAIVDSTIWRNRIADMLIEHMDPWGDNERLNDMGFDEWIDAIRVGSLPIEVSAHSIVTVVDMPSSPEDYDLRMADPERARNERRRLAQWTLGADAITKSIRGIAYDQDSDLLYEPSEWISSQSGTESLRPSNLSETHDNSKGDNSADLGCLGKESQHSESDSRNINSSTTRQTNETEISHSDKGTVGEQSVSSDRSCDSPTQQNELSHESNTPEGWQPEIYTALMEMSRIEDQRRGQDWLNSHVQMFKQALQAENVDAPVQGVRLTPNTGLVHVSGKAVTVGWLEKKQTDLLTRYGIEIVRITPRPGHIAVALKRPSRAILHLADAWMRRRFEPTAPNMNLALVIGEQEDDGELFYLSLKDDFAGREKAATHTLVSGTTGSGKGILTSNLILDLCVFNDPRLIEIYLIDPKRGADYLWVRDLPHLREGIVEEKEQAISLLRNVVRKMDERYHQITQAGFSNIDLYNKHYGMANQLPRIVVFFDEVANWMQDSEFKDEVGSLINQIATKSRAAGIHLFMIYQRADNNVMTMQLRANLGNKLILRLSDEGSSRIALGEKGAERLLGKGHMIAKLGSDEKIYGQVPYIRDDEIRTLAAIIAKIWKNKN